MKILVHAALMAGLAVSFSPAVSLLAAQTQKADQKAAPKEATDPVCGMTVDPATAEKTDYKGKTYYFCSKDDKATFQKSPDKYVKPDTTKK